MRRRGARRARAAAVVEFAVVLPLLLTILFGIIEFGWLFTVRLTLEEAARGGVRVGILQTATEADVQTRVDQVMNGAGISGYTFAYTPSVPGGNPIETVVVSVPIEAVSLVNGYFGGGGNLVASCSMRKEGVATGG